MRINSDLLAFGTLVLATFSHAYIPTRSAGNQASETVSHTSITKEALHRATAKLFNEISRPESTPILTTKLVSPDEMFRLYYGTRSSTKNYIIAVDEIATANAGVDLHSATKNDPTWHFDAEMFTHTNNRLKNLRRGIYHAATIGDYAHARVLTGQLLHALQDFYSHSNWVENGNRRPNYALAVEGQNIGEIASESTATCIDCTLDRTLYPRTYSCRSNLLPELRQQRILTSGYRSGQTFNGKVVTKPANKCSHGGIYDQSEQIPPLGGINKDSRLGHLSSHPQFHSAGVRLATDATVHFLDGLRQSLGNKKFAELLNIRRGRSLVIVMDTTGSMAPYITAAKQRCYALVDAAKNDINSAINDYVLVPFNDPGVGPVLKTENPDAFISNIGNLTASGGDDVPEMCFRGILMASRRSSENSPIFVFTDAPPKDSELSSLMISVLLKRQQTVYFIGRITNIPEYNSAAQLTGGQVLSTSSDVGNIFSISAVMGDSVKGNSNLLAVFNNIAELSKTIDLPVDSGTDKFDVLLKHETTAPVLNVHPPRGAARRTRSTQGYEMVIDTPTTKLYRFDKPTAGQWSFDVIAMQPGWSAEIRGDSFFDIICALQYLEDSGIGYPGLLVLQSNPVVGDNLTLSIKSTCDECVLAEASFVTANGSLLDMVNLTYINDSEEYIADFIVPSVPFYVKVIGHDENGLPFQRLQARQITPTQLRLSFEADNAVEEMRPGEVQNIHFTVTNEGGEATAKLSVDDSQSFVSMIEPETVSIKSNGRIAGWIQVSVPTTAQPGTETDLVASISVTGTSATHNANFFRKKITVVTGTPDIEPPVCTVVRTTFLSNCDASMCAENSWAAEMTFFDADSGIDNVVVTFTGTGNFTWDGESNATSPQIETTPAGVHKMVNANGSCCLQTLIFIISDQSGLNDRCVFNRTELENSVPTTAQAGTETDLVATISVTGTSVTHNANFFRKKITVVTGTPDIEPPVCTVVRTTFLSNCDASMCAENSWAAEMTFFDADSGIDNVVVTFTGTGNFTWDGESNATIPLIEITPAGVHKMVNANGSCCLQTLIFIISDQSGLNDRCVFNRTELENSADEVDEETTTSLYTTETPSEIDDPKGDGG